MQSTGKIINRLFTKANGAHWVIAQLEPAAVKITVAPLTVPIKLSQENELFRYSNATI